MNQLFTSSRAIAIGAVLSSRSGTEHSDGADSGEDGHHGPIPWLGSANVHAGPFE